MEKLKKCPFCGGEVRFATEEGNWILCPKCGAESDYFDRKEEAITAWNTRKPMDHYEDLEERLQSVYGECDGLLEKVVEGLVKHEGVEFEKPMKARLLTDDDVDKWDLLKGAMERIVERLENASYMTECTFDEDGWSNNDNYEVVLLDEAIEIVKGEM